MPFQMPRCVCAIQALAILFLLLEIPAIQAVPDERKISEAIAQLGSDTLKVREDATRFLWEAGRAAGPALREAMKSPDAEVAWRARQVLEQLECGIRPDTPEDIQKLARKYRTGDRAAKEAVAAELAGMKGSGYAVLLAILALEKDDDLRRELVNRYIDQLFGTVSEHMLAGDDERAEAMIELALDFSHDQALDYYPVFFLTHGSLDGKIHQFQVEMEKSPSTCTARALAYLQRMGGDSKGALQMAEKSDDAALVRSILFELGDWKRLAEMQAKAAVGPDEIAKRKLTGNFQGMFGNNREDLENAIHVEQLGFLAAYQRLAGNAEDASKTLAQIQKSNGKGALIQLAARGLFLNERPTEAMALLIQNKQYAQAFDMMSVQMRYREAIGVLEKARNEMVGDELFAMELRAARMWCVLGEKEKAAAILAKLGADEKNKASFEKTLYILSLESESGLREQAVNRFIAAFPVFNDEQGAKALLGEMVFRRGLQADHPWRTSHSRTPAPDAAYWWNLFRKKYRSEDPRVTMKRVMDLMNQLVAGRELEALVAEAETAAVGLTAVQQAEWFNGIAEIFLATGNEEAALAYFKKSDKVLPISATSTEVADILAKQKKWKDAVEWYAHAGQEQHHTPSTVWLRGWALEQDGQKEEGQRLMNLAHQISFDPSVRHGLADTMVARGFPDVAFREYEVITRMGQLTESWSIGFAMEQLTNAAIRKKDFAAATHLYQRRLLNFLHADAYVSNELGLIAPNFLHSLMGREHLAKGRLDEAIQEARKCLDFMPGDTETINAIVPALEKAGRKKDADEMFSGVFDLYDKLCVEYPKSAMLHNNVAWMASRCHRVLDQALAHAQKAVELEPDNAAYLDTLAEVRFQRGEKDAAVDLMKRCIKIDAKNEYFQKQLKRFEAGDLAVPNPQE